MEDYDGSSILGIYYTLEAEKILRLYGKMHTILEIQYFKRSLTEEDLGKIKPYKSR
jgi:hypothetical protein